MDPRGGSHRGFRALPASQRAGFIFTFNPRAHTAPCQIEVIELANATNPLANRDFQDKGY